MHKSPGKTKETPGKNIQKTHEDLNPNEKKHLQPPSNHDLHQHITNDTNVPKTESNEHKITKENKNKINELKTPEVKNVPSNKHSNILLKKEINNSGTNKTKNDDNDESKKHFVWNIQSTSESVTNPNPMIFTKYYNKRIDNEHEFRRLISSYEQYCTDIIYLYQEDNEKANIIEHLIKLESSFKETEEKLLQESEQKKIIQIISEFYCQNDLHKIQELTINDLYNPIQYFPKEIQGLDTKAFFQDFDPSLNKPEIKFDQAKLIQPPNNYDHKLDEKTIDKYDEYVAIVNIIITFQKFIDFKTKFDQQNANFDGEEKKLIQDEMRKEEERNIRQEKEKLLEEKEKIRKEEELLRDEENQIKLNDFDQVIKEKKLILEQLKESISSLQNQISTFEQKRIVLQQQYVSVEKQRINVENEMSQNYNDMLNCLIDTSKKEKKIESMLHDKGSKHHSSQKFKSIENSLESLFFIQMDKSDKESYFNDLVNNKSERQFDIKIKDFCTLTENINIVNEQQFEFMIKYYNHKHAQGDSDCKFIFKNLEIIPISMLKRIYELKDFSVNYLSEKVLDKLVHRSLLVDDLIGDMEKILFMKEKTEEEQEKLINKCKRKYYSICSSTSNEVFIYDDTKIIESHFFNGYSIEKVVIPNSVAEIQDNAFYECKNLKIVVLNCKKLKAIGKSAFSGCINLENFTIPEKIKVIHKCTFLGCQNLTQVVFPPGLEKIKGKAFSGCKSLTDIKIPKNLQKIGKGAFEKCTSLTTFLIPGILAIYPNDEQIPKGFEDETQIQTFKISAKCFSKCREIQNVILTKKCHLIDQYAFNSCAKLENIKYSLSPGSKIEVYAFTDCTQLKKAHFIVSKNSTLEFSDFCFINCKELNEVIFEHKELFADNSLVVNSNVFNGCEKLNKFIFPPNANKDIGECCFEGCKSLEVVSLPNGMTSIKKSMFKGCNLLSTINLDQSITIIEDCAFEDCQKLQIEHLPQDLVRIGDNAFRNCIYLKIQDFPPNLQEIGENAFDTCTKLTEIILPPAIKIIHEKAFENCTELVKVTFHSKSGKILKKAFNKCSNLKKIYTNNKTGISSEAFKDCAKGLEYSGIKS